LGEVSDLYRLQQLELDIDKTRKELKGLPVYAQFKKLQSEVADNREFLSWTESKLAEQRKRTRRLEMEVEKLLQESKDIQARLYSGTIKSAKELEQMENKNKALLRDKNKTEEDLFLALETLEELEAKLLAGRETLDDNSQRLRDMQREGNKEIKSYKDQITALETERDDLRSRISPSLLDNYDTMRVRYHGRPLAHLERDTCSGCRMSVSSNLQNRLCNPAAIINCENCGRLLVPQGS
jgi:predicted  nucleic acid-binding Zn-ribbon protein